MKNEFNEEKLFQLIEMNLKKLPVLLSADGLPAEPARIFYGRGASDSGFFDFNMDFYPPLLYITLYRDYPDSMIEKLVGILNIKFRNCPVLIQDRSIRPAVTIFQSEDVSDEILITENGLKYYLHPLRGQNPGFFIDMRSGRNLIRKTVGLMKNAGSKDINVLNLFSYTCSFSVAALAEGADKVVNIDKNKRSLEIGRKNHILNSDVIFGGYRNQARFLPHDIFKSIGKLRREGPYNIIIADPPPSQKGSFVIQKDYPRLLRRFPEMLSPKGVLFLSCNGSGWNWEDFENMVRNCLPGFSTIEKVQPPDDFLPEEDGRGLKILIVSA